MRRVLPAAVALLGACAGPQASAPVAGVQSPPALVAPVIRNPGFEDAPSADRPCPPHWFCGAHSNVAAFRFFVVKGDAASGAASFCIERTGDEPWAKLSQGFHTRAMAGKRVRLSMAVRVSGLEGGAGPWIESQGGRAYADMSVKSTQGWERVAVELAVPPDSQLLAVGATLTGAGRACFDDVRLELLPVS